MVLMNFFEIQVDCVRRFVDFLFPYDFNLCERFLDRFSYCPFDNFARIDVDVFCTWLGYEFQFKLWVLCFGDEYRFNLRLLYVGDEFHFNLRLLLSFLLLAVVIALGLFLGRLIGRTSRRRSEPNIVKRQRPQANCQSQSY